MGVTEIANVVRIVMSFSFHLLPHSNAVFKSRCMLINLFIVEVLLYVHVGLLGTGVQDVHLDFHTAPEL